MASAKGASKEELAEKVPICISELWSADAERQGVAYQEMLTLTVEPVDWADSVMTEVFLQLSDTNNRNRSIAAQLLCGKAKIRDAGIPYQVPASDELQERIDSVLAVCYLVFNEGYSTSSGESHTRADLTEEAIRLGRLLCELIPDSEGFGLLALMLLHESRRLARTKDDGDLVLLEDQNRSLRNRAMILEALKLTDYYLAHSARGELLRRAGKIRAAKASFERALSLAKQEPERRFLLT